jgi:DNA-binding NtrC family response regulator
MSLKLVYLDDEPDLCDIFMDMFSADDVEVRTFVDPVQAVQSITSEPPDLIFLDYRLPNTTGDKIAVSLDNAIPKVLITGDITVKTEYSFVRVLEKPYRQADVADLIRDLKKRKHP